jgi:hypothetical protein
MVGIAREGWANRPEFQGLEAAVCDSSHPKPAKRCAQSTTQACRLPSQKKIVEKCRFFQRFFVKRL